jgi:hypothetical protein
LTISNHFNLPPSLVDYSNLTYLELFNSKEVKLNNRNLIELIIQNNITVDIQSVMNSLTFLRISDNSMTNQNLNELCPNLKSIEFYNLPETETFTLPTTITRIYFDDCKNIKISNLDELTNLTEERRNEIRNGMRK